MALVVRKLKNRLTRQSPPTRLANKIKFSMSLHVLACPSKSQAGGRDPEFVGFIMATESQNLSFYIILRAYKAPYKALIFNQSL